jgi:hypothetical protein
VIGGYGQYDACAQSHNSLWATAPEAAKTVLNVRCRYPLRQKTHPHIHGPEWREIRLDLDPRPPRHHLLDHRYDAGRNRFSGRNLVFAQSRAPAAPRSAARTQGVLHSSEATGFAAAGLSNLRQVAQLIVENRLEDRAYNSSSGPITPLDMIFGHLASLARGNSFMTHHIGFTARTLQRALVEAGFTEVTLREAPHSICGLPPTGRRAERAAQ